MSPLLRIIFTLFFILPPFYTQKPGFPLGLARGEQFNKKDHILLGSFHSDHRRHHKKYTYQARADNASVLDTLRSRRLDAFAGSLPDSYYLANPADIDAWLSSLSPEGKWPDNEIDYTSGCPARRANWPVQAHWVRIYMMSAAWHGGVPGLNTKYVKNQALRDAIGRAMQHWFQKDIGLVNLDCLEDGGTPLCPCGSAEGYYWNTNWFSNLILIPKLVGRACLFLENTLTTNDINMCSNITLRSFEKFYTTKYPGHVSGANALDIAALGIDGALQGLNTSVIGDAYNQVHGQMVLQTTPQSDGIYYDGSFSQHLGLLYNGNYGKVYAQAVLGLETASAGTEYASSKSQQNAFGVLFDGNSWTIVKNVKTGILHWDLSVIGRFITFPVVDQQASGYIQLNLTQIGALGKSWGSASLTNFAKALSKNSRNANAGSKIGNYMFYANDYMVHRGKDYVTSVKMFSKRTINSECTNSQNPYGFHLSDGTVYTYQNGDEYEDIAAAWDWEMIPGITINRGGTALSCDKTGFVGIESFVGGVSDGSVGAAAMRYTNPNTQAFQFQKAWFFLDDDVQVVLVSNVTSGSSIFSILDQKKHSGRVLIDGKEMQGADAKVPGAKTLWHDNIGYVFPPATGIASLGVNVGTKTGNWSLIGISVQPPAIVDLFSAWLEHATTSSPFAYLIYPSVDYNRFVAKNRVTKVQIVKNDGVVAAVYDRYHKRLYAIFWDANGGSVDMMPVIGIPLILSSNKNSAIIYDLNTRHITASDPSQTLSSFQVEISHIGFSKTFTVNLPSGGKAGSSVIM